METDHALVAAVDAYDEARMAANFTGPPADFAAYRERERMSPANKAAIAPFICEAVAAYVKALRPPTEEPPERVFIRFGDEASYTAIRMWTSTASFPFATEYRRVD